MSRRRARIESDSEEENIFDNYEDENGLEMLRNHPACIARSFEFLTLTEVLMARLVCRSFLEASQDLDPSWCAHAFQNEGLKRRNATMIQVWKPNNGDFDEAARMDDGMPLRVEETKLFPIPNDDDDDASIGYGQEKNQVASKTINTNHIHKSSHFDKMLKCFQALSFVPNEAVVCFNLTHGRHVMPISTKNGNIVRYPPCRRGDLKQDKTFHVKLEHKESQEEKNNTNINLTIPRKKRKIDYSYGNAHTKKEKETTTEIKGANKQDDSGCPTCRVSIPTFEWEVDEIKEPSRPMISLMKALSIKNPNCSEPDLTSYYNTCVRNLPPSLRCPHCRDSNRTLVLAVVSYKSETSFRPRCPVLSYTPETCTSPVHSSDEQDSADDNSVHEGDYDSDEEDDSFIAEEDDIDLVETASDSHCESMIGCDDSKSLMSVDEDDDHSGVLGESEHDDSDLDDEDKNKINNPPMKDNDEEAFTAEPDFDTKDAFKLTQTEDDVLPIGRFSPPPEVDQGFSSPPVGDPKMFSKDPIDEFSSSPKEDEDAFSCTQNVDAFSSKNEENGDGFSATYESDNDDSNHLPKKQKRQNHAYVRHKKKTKKYLEDEDSSNDSELYSKDGTTPDKLKNLKSKNSKVSMGNDDLSSKNEESADGSALEYEQDDSDDLPTKKKRPTHSNVVHKKKKTKHIEDDESSNDSEISTYGSTAPGKSKNLKYKADEKLSSENEHTADESAAEFEHDDSDDLPTKNKRSTHSNVVHKKKKTKHIEDDESSNDSEMSSNCGAAPGNLKNTSAIKGGRNMINSECPSSDDFSRDIIKKSSIPDHAKREETSFFRHKSDFKSNISIDSINKHYRNGKKYEEPNGSSQNNNMQVKPENKVKLEAEVSAVAGMNEGDTIMKDNSGLSSRTLNDSQNIPYKCPFPNVKEYSVQSQQSVKSYHRDSSTKHAIVLCCVSCNDFGIAIPSNICIDRTVLGSDCGFHKSRYTEEKYNCSSNECDDAPAMVHSGVLGIEEGTTFITQMCSRDECLNPAFFCNLCQLCDHVPECSYRGMCEPCSLMYIDTNRCSCKDGKSNNKPQVSGEFDSDEESESSIRHQSGYFDEQADVEDEVSDNEDEEDRCYEFSCDEEDDGSYK